MMDTLQANGLTLTSVSKDGSIEALCSLAAEIWREHYTPILGSAQVEYMLEHFQSPQTVLVQIEEGYRYFFLTDHGVRAGYCALLSEENDLYISKLYLRQDFRGRGLGHQAVRKIASMARKEGLPALRLNVNRYNAASIAAYEGMGFVRAGEEFIPIGEGFFMDDFVMQMIL